MRLTKFTAGLMALSLAIGGFSAAPARADGEDVAKVLGGLLTLYVIGKAIDDNKSDKKQTASKPKQPNKKKTHDHPHKENPFDRMHRKPGLSYVIPSECIMTARGRHGGPQLVAFDKCLKRKRPVQAHLPVACETRVSTRHGKSKAYEMGCLTNFGYRVRDMPPRHSYAR